MKGAVFSFKRRSSGFRRVKFPSPGDVRNFFSRYGLTLGFAAAFIAGLSFGAVCAAGADSALLDSLDILFVTNLDVRLQQGAVATFCACFASDFIFLCAVFLLGLSPWGVPVLPFVSAFKGFGTGLTAAYLACTYSLGGAGFYLLVLLPGTFLFCVSLVKFSVRAAALSAQMFLYTIGRERSGVELKTFASRFCSRSIPALITAFFAALLDTVLWCLFSGMFGL